MRIYSEGGAGLEEETEGVLHSKCAVPAGLATRRL